ncbi:MAG: SUMF1/EgtB/PvdO family nonheme iron enzyme, partial [Planctomycetales bacterium]|nr:SUMF1/EgtB/PvdO family nonheme iron enzyme [Planctomycetales bacterium]
MLADDRYALLLRPQIAANLSAEQVAEAADALSQQMALVPAGDVSLAPFVGGSIDDDRPRGERLTHVAAALLDRWPVTNGQYKRFVDAGGYEQVALWDPVIFPAIFEFVDLSGQPGPRFWQDGAFPAGEENRPVVGVNWYEAEAYARWVGKRLPCDAEWVKAAAWPAPSSHGGRPTQRRYPWGDAWEPQMANTWSAALGRTCDVAEFAAGASLAGVYGLLGNVWEWTAD